MPHYAWRFGGHLRAGDPRTLATAAGGCTWPTIPAHRYLITSTNATGIWEYLNTTGILVQKAGIHVAHNTTVWVGPLNVCPCTTAWARKDYHHPDVCYEWHFVIWTTGAGGFLRMHVVRPYSPCNCNLDLGSHHSEEPPRGDTGSGCVMRQVEFDQTEPPGGWPL